jgi:hypothetical protein
MALGLFEYGPSTAATRYRQHAAEESQAQCPSTHLIVKQLK